MEDNKPFRVIIWGVPRSISTCVLKCLSFLPDCQTWFEPYCLADMTERTLQGLGITIPRLLKDVDQEKIHEQVRQRMEAAGMDASAMVADDIDNSLFTRDGARIQLDSLPAGQSCVVKDMAFSITGFHDMLPCKESNFRHVFLIRKPECMFPSWRNLLIKQLLKNPTFRTDMSKQPDEATFDMTTDVTFMQQGYTYKCQYDLWKHVVSENLDPNPVFVDCDELAMYPADILPKLCAAAGLPYNESLLQWDASPDVCESWRSLYSIHKKNSGRRGIHEMALNSTCFKPPKPPVPRDQMTPDVVKCVDATQDYYQEMASHRVKPDVK